MDILHAKYEREAGFYFLIADTPFRADVQQESEDHAAMPMPAVARGGAVHNRRETAETGSIWTVPTKTRVLLLYNKTVHFFFLVIVNKTIHN